MQAYRVTMNRLGSRVYALRDLGLFGLDYDRYLCLVTALN